MVRKKIMSDRITDHYSMQKPLFLTFLAISQRKSVEHRLRWVPNAKLSRWPCRFHVVYLGFFRVGYLMQMLFSVEYGLNVFHKR